MACLKALSVCPRTVQSSCYQGQCFYTEPPHPPFFPWTAMQLKPKPWGGGESWRDGKVQPSFTASALTSLCSDSDRWAWTCSVGQAVGGLACFVVSSSTWFTLPRKFAHIWRRVYETHMDKKLYCQWLCWKGWFETLLGLIKGNIQSTYSYQAGN